MKTKIKLIINPVAGNGSVKKKWSHVRRIASNLFKEISWDFTKKPADAIQLTRKAIHEGYETIVAVGGDGTIHEVVNGFFENGEPIHSDAVLGMISMGTGCDLAKSLELPHSLHTAMAKIKNHRCCKFDVGKLTYTKNNGKNGVCFFINIADAGFGGAMVEVVNQSSKALGQFVAYVSALLRTLATYKNKSIHIKIDDIFEAELTVNSVVVANGQFFGGGMWIAPKAVMNDGLFDITIIGDVTRRDVLAQLHKLYNGTLHTHPKVQTFRGKTVTLTSKHLVKLDADGEAAGVLPAYFEILPAALNVII